MSRNLEYPKNHGKAQIYDQQLRKSHLDPPSRVSLIHNGMSSIYNGRSSILKNLCSKSTRKSIRTQLIEHRIEWQAIIITLTEMSGRKRKQLTLGSWKGFKEI